MLRLDLLLPLRSIYAISPRLCQDWGNISKPLPRSEANILSTSKFYALVWNSYYCFSLSFFILKQGSTNREKAHIKMYTDNKCLTHFQFFFSSIPETPLPRIFSFPYNATVWNSIRLHLVSWNSRICYCIIHS